MVFSSITFLSVFLPGVFLLHWLLPDIRLKNVFLILASLTFYAYGEPIYVLLLIVSAFANYLFGRLVRTGSARRKWFLWAAVAVNIGLLAVFKYLGFVVELLNGTGAVRLPVPQIRLPIGISFFTFQALSYVIDVYRGKAESQKNFEKVLLYISFFP